ncbi:sensor domain-containing protein [Blastococcus sp. PRF04-17]|uniref:sensor domain-containing protein n=1 Tax=Blastococcus sp. PRF04-17 TaxID=2933797 RepID=UPI001FF2C37D|nr:EAL domain-containing protein [Blastococcus sp. PRF04-17]UOY00479.1 EAL domain-containing protein [Blastococcus sp. PRF04-17]
MKLLSRNRRATAAAAGLEAPTLADRLLAITDQGVYAVDMDGRCIMANEAAARLLGTVRTLLLGTVVHDEHHGRPADEPADACPLCAPIHAGRPARGSTNLVQIDGTSLAVDFVSSLVSHDGQPIAIFWFQDVAGRAQTEAAMRQLEMKYRAVTESASDAIVSADARGLIVSWNRGGEAMFGYTEADVIGKPLTVLMPERYRDAHERGMGRFLLTGEPRVIGSGAVEVHALRKDGTEFPVELSLSHWSEGDGRFFTGILRDITERKRAEDALAREAGFVKLLQRVSVASNESSSGREALEAGMRLIAEHTGWKVAHIYEIDEESRDQLLPSNIWTHPDDDRLQPFLAATRATPFAPGTGLPGRALAAKQACWISDVTIDDNFPRRDAARESGLAAAFAFPVMVDTEVVAVLEFFTSERLEPDEDLCKVMEQIGSQLGRVIERELAREQLTHHALHDPLTGLPNRTLLLDRLEVALAQRNRGSAAVVFVDLDHFKLINDSLGHAAGDKLLCGIAVRLRAILRPGDTVARFGGDEFIILAESVADERDAEGLAERITSALAAPFDLAGEEVFVTASIGIAVSGGPDCTANNLLRDADAAMYRAKEDGRARHEVFDAGMRAGAVRRLEIVNDLHRALERDQFILHFQPQIDLQTNTLVGVEALLRWVHPDRGLVPPMEFIPIAEETGLINDLGRWVLRAACAQGREWMNTFPDNPPLTISVNLSGRQLQQSRLADEVAAALRDFDFPPELLVLEITETVLMNDTSATIATLNALKELGVRLAIDDFGTGYSSLTYLQRFPIDILKIDKSFVDGLGGQNVEESAVARTIVALAKTLRLETVAEGVERSEHVRELQTLNCDIAQGYFFARPLDARSLEVLLLSPHTPMTGADVAAQRVPSPRPAAPDDSAGLVTSH